jgi:NADH-quinone oxidoreductase subunit H
MIWPLELGLRMAAVLGFILFTVLVLIWVERKFLGHIQMRLGPMRTGFHGVLQSPADAVKLLLKEDLMPASADRWVFQLAPLVVALPAFMIWVSIPFTRELVVRSLDMGIFYIVAISALSIVGMVMAGWASDNKYALLGAARSAAQMISYELPLVFSILGVVMVAGSLDLREIVGQQAAVPFIILQPLGFLLFLMAGLAEVGRTPFDIPHAESEVVGGPFIEYSGIRWGFFFAAEYINTFAVAALCALLFLGGWNWPGLPPLVWFLVKTYAVVLVIIWLRATFPRLRIDQLMSFAWKFLLPLAFLNILLNGLYLFYGWPSWTISLASLAVVVGAGLELRRRQRRTR